MPDRKLAVVTGASTGIGKELARCAALDGCDLVIAANELEIEEAAEEFRGLGAQVDVVQVDLSTEEGVIALTDMIGTRDVDYLMANAGLTLGHAFTDQAWPDIREVLGLNIVGTTFLLHRILPRMKIRREGRVMITGSIAGFIPGSYQAVYNASKAYLDMLSFALNDELKEHGVTVTCLMPGPVETPVFDRGDMRDSAMGSAPVPIKDTPEHTARVGYEAMKAGKAGMTPGLMNKLIVGFAGILPEAMLARMNRWVSETDEDKAKS
jgi:short-subunit dehydrogenase